MQRNCGTESEPSSEREGRFRPALRLLGWRRQLAFTLLTSARIAVGFCDLGVAAAMYLLFLLLQGRVPTHHVWWTPKTTLVAASLTIALVILRAATDMFSARSVCRQIQNLYSDLLLRLTQGYSEMRWGRFVECNRSELCNHTLYTAREAADFYQRCIELAAAAVIIAAMIAVILYQSSIAGCAFILVLLGFYGVHRFVIRTQVQAAASDREQSLRGLQKSLTDMLSSGKEIRTYGNQPFFHDRIRRQAERLSASNIRALFRPQVARGIADHGAVLLLLGIIVVVQLRQGDPRQLLSLLAFYFVLSRRLLPLISLISFTAGQMESSYENVKIVDEELNECRRYRMTAPPADPPDSGLVLDLSRVSFSFNDGAAVLRSINLFVRSGETVVLHGVSGAGKSSLLNVIAGVLEPIAGTVRIDRTSLTYVPQETLLLDDSIRNNLLFGLSNKSDAELMDALAIANLDRFVATQPRGLETEAGDNGILFSGGQRQRLGLARAILRGGRLLLLDEATSALDEENERQILENLSARGSAVLLVTHRLQARRFADRVFRIQDGVLIEESSAGCKIADTSMSLRSGLDRNPAPEIALR